MNLSTLARPPIAAVAAAMLAFGANPVGRVIATGTVEVDGIKAPARNFLPVSIGDLVTTRDGSAVVQFPDGRCITLRANSSVRIEGAPGEVSVRVVRGSTISGPSRNTAPSQGMGAPGSSVLTGGFIAAPGPGGPAVLLPNGLTLNLSAATNPTTGAVTYTVVSVTASTMLLNGQITTTTVTSGALIGDTVTLLRPTATGAASGTFTVTSPGGSPVVNPNGVLQNMIPTGTIVTTSNSLSGNATAPSPVSPVRFSPSGS